MEYCAKIGPLFNIGKTNNMYPCMLGGPTNSCPLVFPYAQLSNHTSNIFRYLIAVVILFLCSHSWSAFLLITDNFGIIYLIEVLITLQHLIPSVQYVYMPLLIACSNVSDNNNTVTLKL